MPDTSVKLFQSTDAGAPSLSSTAGSAIAVLDACLVNGYGSVTLTSLVVSGNVATATCNAGHGFAAFNSTYPVIQIAGATPGVLNGQWRLASIPDATHFTFATTGISDQTATGTITAKRAAAGWTKPYSGTNLAAYRNNTVSGTGMYLRVDDTGTSDVRIVGYEGMTDVNTGTGPFPTAAQISGGAYFGKANTTSGSRAWIVIATDALAYVFFASNATYPSAYGSAAFGDLTSLKSGDSYRGVLAGIHSASAASAAYSFFGDYAGAAKHYSPRSYTGVGTSQLLTLRVPGGVNTTFLSGNGTLTYPNGPDNGLLLYPNLRLDEGNHARHVFPGVYVSPQNLASALGSSLFEVLNVPGLTGRALIGIPQYINIGVGFVDITGPW